MSGAESKEVMDVEDARVLMFEIAELVKNGALDASHLELQESDIIKAVEALEADAYSAGMAAGRTFS